MSTQGSTLLQCEDVQRELNELVNICGSEAMYPDSPFGTFITSDANRSGLQFTVAPGAGKVRDVIGTYRQKLLGSAVTEVDECELDCTAETKRGNMSTPFTIDICLKNKVEELIDIYDLARVCTDNRAYYLQVIDSLLAAIEEKVITDLAAQAVALNGNWSTFVTGVTGDALQVNTRLTGTQNLNPFFMPEIDLALKQTRYCSAVGIFGSSELQMAAQLLGAGCCTSTGMDLLAILQQYGKSIAWDPYIATAFGSNNMSLATQLGSLQLVSYTVGTEANFRAVTSIGTDFELIPMFTRQYGIPVDMVVSNKCGKLHIIMTTTNKLFNAPLDLFPVGDVYEGVNFTNLIQVVNT